MIVLAIPIFCLVLLLGYATDAALADLDARSNRR